MAYDNGMKGTLGANKRREKDTHPSHTGQCEIDGVSYWISAWVKENGSTGEKFFSLSFKEKDDRPPAPRPPSGPLGADEFDDEIPF